MSSKGSLKSPKCSLNVPECFLQMFPNVSDTAGGREADLRKDEAAKLGVDVIGIRVDVMGISVDVMGIRVDVRGAPAGRRGR